MKKLKLKTFELGDREMLTRDQLKNVLGGDQPTGYYRCCYYSGCETDQSMNHCEFYQDPPDTCVMDGYTYPLLNCL